MTNSQRLATVRQCLNQWLSRQLNQTPEQASEVESWRESILVRDGFYCGRRFDAGLYEAVWFLEEDELKVSNQLGEVLCVYHHEEISESAAAQPKQLDLADQQEAPLQLRIANQQEIAGPMEMPRKAA